MKNILIIKTSSLGDIIHTFPVVSYLQKKWPHSNIDWVVEKNCSELVLAHPQIHRVICVETKKWRDSFFSKTTWKEFSSFREELRKTSYDVAFDLQGNCKSGFITSQVRALDKVGFGLNTIPEWPNILSTRKRYNPPQGLNIRLDYLYPVQKYFNDFEIIHEPVSLNICSEEQVKVKALLLAPQISSGKRIMICPGSAWKNKQLRFDSLKQWICSLRNEHNCSLFYVWGNQEERNLVENLCNLYPQCSFIVPKLSISSLQYLMKEMDLIVAMDSLALHLAGTTAIPTLSFFGPSSASKYRPLGEAHETIQGKCPYGMKFEKRCPILRTCPTGSCIVNIQLPTKKGDEVNLRRE